MLDNVVVQMIASLSKTSELGRRLKSYSLDIPSEDIADENYFKYGEPFILPHYMVGDVIFQLKDYLMRPYPGKICGKLPIDQVVFNYRLSRARRVIENSFGILVTLWRVFHKPIRADKENITSFVLAGVALHNYLQQTENASYCPRRFVDFEANREFWPGEWQRIFHGDARFFIPYRRYRGSPYEDNAIKMRNDLIDYVKSDIGSLPWQLNYVQRTGRVSEETDCKDYV